MLSGLMCIVAYLFGSISGAMIVSQLLHLKNPKEHGSQNPGATNMLRVNGWFSAIFVLIFDMLKGMLPVYFAYRLGVSHFFLGLIAIFACIGHILPCFHHFRGGKGVATALGSMLLISVDSSGLFVFTWLFVLAVTGYSSIAALISFLLAPFYVWFFRPEFTMPVAMLSCLIILRHMPNIERLMSGKEQKIARKKLKT